MQRSLLQNNCSKLASLGRSLFKRLLSAFNAHPVQAFYGVRMP